MPSPTEATTGATNVRTSLQANDPNASDSNVSVPHAQKKSPFCCACDEILIPTRTCLYGLCAKGKKQLDFLICETCVVDNHRDHMDSVNKAVFVESKEINKS